MWKVAFFKISIEDYTQRERNALFTVNKEKVRKPIGARSDVCVKITNNATEEVVGRRMTRNSEYSTPRRDIKGAVIEEVNREEK